MARRRRKHRTRKVGRWCVKVGKATRSCHRLKRAAKRAARACRGRVVRGKK